MAPVLRADQSDGTELGEPEPTGVELLVRIVLGRTRSRVPLISPTVVGEERRSVGSPCTRGDRHDVGRGKRRHQRDRRELKDLRGLGEMQ